MSRNTKIWPGNVMILANLFGFLCNVLDKHTDLMQYLKHNELSFICHCYSHLNMLLTIGFK